MISKSHPLLCFISPFILVQHLLGLSKAKFCGGCIVDPRLAQVSQHVKRVVKIQVLAVAEHVGKADATALYQEVL